jgi:membrane protease YdiL (CAAX protease family)
MAEIARLFRFDDQPPLIQLLFSFCIVVVAGTLLFWLFLLAGSIFTGLAPGEMIRIPSSDEDASGKLILKYVQLSQQAGLFLIPSLIIAYLIRKGNESFLKLARPPVPIRIILVVSLAFMLVPVLNYTGILNSRMMLPESLSGIEEWMRSKEDSASYLTSLLLSSSGLMVLVLNIFILAVIPAISEEFLFRGVLQQILNRLLRSSHAGIWLTAIIFSSIHFQFFGFLPRLILGLVFGYLFYWTGNLWYSVAAHFVNNLIPVMAAWVNGLRGADEQIAQSGKIIGVFPLVSIVLSGLILLYFWRESGKRSGVTAESSSGGAGEGT